MKIYLINLDRSPDRLQWFLETNAALADRVERVQAIDGRDLAPETIDRYRSMRGRETILGVGDIACALSHALAWKSFVDSGHPWAFFAEDDLFISPDASGFFDNTGWIPDDADVVKAETFMTPTSLSRRNFRPVFGRNLAPLQAQHLGTAGYFLSARTAAWLLDYSKTVLEPPDQILFGAELGVFPTLRIYQIDPALCIQNRFLTTASGEADLSSARLETNAELGEPVYAGALKRMKKPTGWAKVRRELGRPFARLFWHRWQGLIQRRLRIVPFR